MSTPSLPAGTALIQGASRGIGLALVRALLERCDPGSPRPQPPSFDRIIATCRDPASASHLQAINDPRLEIRALDIAKADHIERFGRQISDDGIGLRLVINVAGILHGDEFGPEKKLEDLQPEALSRVFAVNAFGPILLLNALRPSLARRGKCVFAAISARVGSIADNRLGGWYAYRASKSALNQFLKTAAIELARRNRNAIVAALHPGTTDTGLSKPFQSNVPEDKLFSTAKTAGLLLEVIDGLAESDSGGFFGWDGSSIPW